MALPTHTTHTTSIQASRYGVRSTGKPYAPSDTVALDDTGIQDVCTESFELARDTVWHVRAPIDVRVRRRARWRADCGRTSPRAV
jgi:hypothetical protein